MESTDFLTVDVVIVGSGCGGGIMAEQLVNAGHNVLVLEKGGYYQPTEFTKWRECEAMSKLYEKGGLCASDDGSIVILAGSTIGGGSTVNWTASFKTPSHVLTDWKDHYHLPWFEKDGEFEQSMNYVLSRMNVNTENSYFDDEVEAKEKGVVTGKPLSSFVMNENNRLFWKSSEKLGFKPEKIPRNVKQCVDCGHCGFGCSYKSKQSTSNAILEPILLSQHKEIDTQTKTDTSADLKGKVSASSVGKKGKLFIIPDCNVQQVITTINPENAKRKTALGIKAIVSVYEKGLGSSLDRVLIKTRALTVDAKITICSAGSLHTPALLLRSHFEHRLIGKNLTLHPVLGVAGIFPSSIKPGLDKGVGMGVVVREPSVNASKHVEKEEEKEYCRNHPIALETPPIHLGLCLVF
jgi:long-chain-alcohol oxidase